MQIGDSVQVYSGVYVGYYGLIKEIGTAPDHADQVRVSHKVSFAGFWINVADLVEPEYPESENE